MERQVLSPTSQQMRMMISLLNGGATMTELQELMLYTCVGAMSGMFIAENHRYHHIRGEFGKGQNP